MNIIQFYIISVKNNKDFETLISNAEKEMEIITRRDKKHIDVMSIESIQTNIYKVKIVYLKN